MPTRAGRGKAGDCPTTSPVCFYSAKEGERLRRSPSLSLLLTMHPREGTHPPCTPRCAGGKLLASAAPSPGRRCPFGRCSSRAKSARRSPTGTADRQQLRRREGAPGVVAPCGGWRQQCAALPPQPAPPARLPLLCSDSPAVGAGCPGTPPAQRPPRCCG